MLVDMVKYMLLNKQLKMLNKKKKVFSKGILIGSAMGMIVGILLRTKKGKKLTNDLVSKSKDLTKKSKQKAMQSMDKMKDDTSSPLEI